MLGDWRLAILGVAVLGSLLVVMQLKPIPQDPTYHAFADQRAFLGIPSFANVISNVPFLLVGVAGWRFCHRHRQPKAPRSWTVFFLGVAMIAFGSAYYHWTPDNQTLVWDRLPITVAFMALFVAVLAEHLSPAIEPVGLVSAIAAGAGSLAWWVCSDDLRLYGWVQFVPLITIAALFILFPARYTQRTYLLLGLAFYLFAKGAESYDVAIYALTGETIGGHAIKHLLAAGGPLWIYFMLRRRSAVSA